MTTTFAIIFRTGGTVNFKWNLVLESFPTREAARIEAAKIERMGFATRIHDAKLLGSIGMPETFE